MSISLRQKQLLYNSLGQLVRSGIPFPAALDKLVNSTRGKTRRLIEAARQSLARGHTVGEAFAAQPDIVTPLEASVIAAVEKSGHLERGLQDLSDYFGVMNAARLGIIKRSAYPVFVLHFGILILSVSTIFTKGASAYFREVGTAFALVYGTAIVLALAIPLVRELATVNSPLDRLLITIPVIGTIRRSFALSRFCTVYGIQLDAGINVIDSVISAGRCSLSALVRTAVDGAVPRIRTGSQVGPLLAASDAFPTDVTQAIIVGEETGALDDELRRLAKEFREKAFSALEAFAEWLPKLLYTAVCLYMGWKIVVLYQTVYLAPLKGIME